MRTLLFLVIAVQASSLVPVRAQSLGDVARQEEERRKSIKPSGKVYTNDTLRGASSPAPTAPAPAGPGTAPPSATTPAAAGAGQAQAESAKKTDESLKDQDYWRSRLASARDALSRSQMFAEALQSRINALTTDFVNRDDPAQRDQIGVDRQKALAELDRVKKDIVDQTKAIADTEEEARQAGVPPGWLR